MVKWIAIFLVIIAAIIFGCWPRGGEQVLSSDCEPGEVCGSLFDHIIIVMFENEHADLVEKNETFSNIATSGAGFKYHLNLSKFYGVSHPSQTNYIASASGQIFNFNDGPNPPRKETNIIDRFKEKKISWKAYMEDMNIPTNRSVATPDNYPYVRKHNPFIQFDSNLASGVVENIVKAQDNFQQDIDGGKLPNYAWYTPNLNNDGHDVSPDWCRSNGFPNYHTESGDDPCNVARAGYFLRKYFMPMIAPEKLPPRTLVVITFDESFPKKYKGDQGDPGCRADDDNCNPSEEALNVYTVLLSNDIPLNAEDGNRYDHINLLRTIEENWGLAPMSGPWQEYGEVGTPSYNDGKPLHDGKPRCGDIDSKPLCFLWPSNAQPAICSQTLDLNKCL